MVLGPIPFNDLARGLVGIRGDVDAAIDRVISSGWFVLGPEHDALEHEIAQYVGTKYAVNVGNGTDALELALSALGVTVGSVVFTVANAGAYATTAALLLGAEPVFVDVDPSTHLMSGASLEAALAACEQLPAAIVVTHLYGALAPMPEIMQVARKHGVAVLEDCAQSFGARWGDAMGGSFGDIATTSFYPTKNLGALGDGGAVFTNSSDLAARVRHMRQYGWESKYSIEHAHGRNSRLDEIQAAVLRTKLPFLEEKIARRRQIHQQYEDAAPAGFRMVNTSNSAFTAHLAVVECSEPESARRALTAKGISTDVHYPIPDHKQKFPDFKPRQMPLGVTESLAPRIFTVPLFPELTDEEVIYVSEALRAL
jgi:dTDP-4-amino-4,6-dideoxygalactose transaminase